MIKHDAFDMVLKLSVEVLNGSIFTEAVNNFVFKM